MKRLAILVAIVALLLSACGSGGELAATVNGTEIHQNDLDGMIDPADPESITPAALAQLLQFQVFITIIRDSMESEYGITFDDDQITAEADSIVEGALTEGQTREEFLKEREVTEEFLSLAAEQQLLGDALREQLRGDAGEITQEEVDAGRRQAELELSEVCASHILVDTEQEAQDVLDRLDAGEEFADIASEVSTDTGSGVDGGDLGCAPPAKYVAEFAEATMDAELGVPTGPVESEFGFHVILVTKRTEADPSQLPTDDELKETLLDQAADEAANQWFVEQAGSADVTVESAFGTWQTDPSPAVVAPTG